MGYQPQLSYNVALCHYMLRQYAPALKNIADIIEKGIKEHPGMCTLVLRSTLVCVPRAVVDMLVTFWHRHPYVVYLYASGVVTILSWLH